MRRLGRGWWRLLASAAAAAALLAAAPAPPPAPSLSPDELLVKGNDLYAHGDYAGAARDYRQILAAGIRNAGVYYNLGNACFRQNRIGEAILNYEKALRLDPTDVEARENLRYANLKIRDRIPEEDPPLPLALLERGLDLLRLGEVTRLFLALYLGAMALLAVWIVARSRRWGRWVGAAALAILVLSLAAGGWMLVEGHALSASNEAIVLSEKADVLSGPGTENTLLASVHEGTKVRIHNRREVWVQVTLPDGRAGWMRENALGII